MSDQQPTTVPDMRDLLSSLTEKVEGGIGELRKDLEGERNARESAEGALQEITGKQAEMAEQMEGLKRSLDENRVRLPGVEDEVKKGNVRMGDFLASALVEHKQGAAEADRQFGLAREMSREVMKRLPETAEMRVLSSEISTGAGSLVPEEVSSEFISALYPMTAMGAVGARSITGVTGSPYRVNRQSGKSTFYWVGENNGPDASQISTGRVNFTPRKGAVLSGMTDEQAMLSGPNLNSIIEEDMRRQFQLGLEKGALEGTGGEYQPLGLAFQDGVTNYDASNDPTAAPNGRDLTDYHMVRMRQTTEEKNVPMTGFGYVMHTKQKNILALQWNAEGGNVTAGTPDAFPHVGLLNPPIYTDEQIRARFGPIGHSTQFDSDLQPSGSSSTDHARLWAGNWANFWTVFWGVMVIKASNEATVNGQNAFINDLNFLKLTQLVDSAPVRPEDFLQSTDFRTNRSGV